MRTPLLRCAVTSIALLGAIALQACTITREIRPVGQGHFAAGVSAGGPIFTNLGAPIPTPILSAYGRYGILNTLDLDFGLDLTPVRAEGIDLGVAYLFRDQAGAVPAVMGGLRGYLFVNGAGLSSATNPDTGAHYTLEPVGFEELYGNVSWKLGRPWLLYTGVDVFSEIQDGIVQPSLVLGAEYRFTHIGISAEVRQAAFIENEKYLLVEYVGPASYGAFSFLLGLEFYPSGAP